MLKGFTRLCLLLIAVTVTPALVRAEPVIITSGSLAVTGLSGSPVYSFLGTNFAAVGTGLDSGFTGPEVSCFPCVSGNLININSLFVDVSLGKGNVTIDGSTFNQIFIRGVLTFSGSSVVVPDGGLDIILTAPFSLSGLMEGCLVSHATCQTVVFSTQVSGSGVATIQLQGFVDSEGHTLYLFRNVTYTFDNTAVPEPASILILTSGLTALGARKLRLLRKRRHRC